VKDGRFLADRTDRTDQTDQSDQSDLSHLSDTAAKELAPCCELT
jgi:hypothetical protein